MLVNGVDAAAVDEQNAALDCCVNGIDQFLCPSASAVRFPCLVGRPGSGKSFVLKLSLAYALARGLKVELMSWTSERARQLGGNHLHLVFPLQVCSSRMTFSRSIVSQCIAKLERDPLRKAIIQRTDVFFFEEIGLLSSEYFTALDNVLRIVMENELPWGGKLLVSCGDSKQLPPIDGRPIWGSINMVTMMDVFIFKSDVRATDPVLRWINSECRRKLDAYDCSKVVEVIRRECRFVSSWTEVPDIAVRIVPTKAAEQQVMAEYLEARCTTNAVAIDEVQNGTLWEKAGPRVTLSLNRTVYEYSVCRLYLHALVRMTYNRSNGTPAFSQGQIAIVMSLPDTSVAFMQQRITLRLAPAGVRHIDVVNIPADWPLLIVGPRTTPPVLVGSYLQMGRRTQFPIRYYMCSTIHRIQGDTVNILATELSASKREYRLWQKEQFTVLISRVCNVQRYYIRWQP